MLLRLILAGAVGCAAGVVPRHATACDCPAGTAAAHLAAADTVFLAVASAPLVKGRQRVQALRVLHAFKGKPGKWFVIRRRADRASGCDRWYAEGETAVVYVVKGAVALCAGNEGLESQLRDLDALVAAAGRSAPVGVSAVQAALGAVLTPYLHGRSEATVVFGALAGRSLTVGRTRLAIVAAAPPAVTGVTVDIEAAVARGPLSFVRGAIRAEGMAFSVLVLRNHETLIVLGARLAEAKGPPAPYRCQADADCVTTCSLGAVNRPWWAANKNAALSACEDGCTSKGTDPARCVDGLCVGFFRGKRQPHCTRKPLVYIP